LLQPAFEQGYVIPAFDTDVKYSKLAQRLADSIHQFDPEAAITILTNDDLHNTNVTGQALDYFAYKLSPYRETIKLEADMLMASPINHWWTMFRHRDVVISTGCRDFYGRVSDCRFYRRVFDENQLPDVYNAITYWRRSDTAAEFFRWVRAIFEDWSTFRRLLKFSDDVPSTDVVYAMAAQIVGAEKVTMPFATYPKIVHMKKHIVPIRTNNWTQELVWETDPLRIQTVAQWGAFHYYVKDWQL
jgi:hypothetical protein